MRGGWNRGLKKETSYSVLKISNTMRSRGIDNFRKWREEQKKSGLIKSSYPSFERNGDLAELIGVILGDGHIGKFQRCESVRIVGSANNPGFVSRYAMLLERVVGREAHVALRSYSNAYNITIYEKELSRRLGLPTGSRRSLKYRLPTWISQKRAYRIRFLRGLYEAEGSLCHHAPTSTHKFLFANRNPSLIKLVARLVTDLGFYCYISSHQVQVSRKLEVQKLASLLQFRRYES